MRSTPLLAFPRRLYVDMDFGRHFPKSYLDELKRHIPRKVWANRFGSPDLIRWRIKPNDPTRAISAAIRPWSQEAVHKALERERDYHNFLLTDKAPLPSPNLPWDKEPFSKVKRIPDEKWTFLPGDLVQVMVGKDRNAQGNVSHVIREANAIYVEGLHTKLKAMREDSERFGFEKMLRWEEQPLFVHRNEVKLVDPNDKGSHFSEPCDAEWILNDAKDAYIRISTRTGFEIPVPRQAQVTYEYVTPADYIEVPGKDTPAKAVLDKTYIPKLATFEQELEEAYEIKETRKRTFWY